MMHTSVFKTETLNHSDTHPFYDDTDPSKMDHFAHNKMGIKLCEGGTRTRSFQVMSLTSYQLLNLAFSVSDVTEDRWLGAAGFEPAAIRLKAQCSAN